MKKLLIALTIILFFQNPIVKKDIYLVMKILKQGLGSKMQDLVFLFIGVFIVF